MQDDPDFFSNIRLPTYKYNNDEHRFDEADIPSAQIFKVIGFNN